VDEKAYSDSALWLVFTPGYEEADMALKEKCPPFMYANCF